MQTVGSQESVSLDSLDSLDWDFLEMLAMSSQHFRNVIFFERFSSRFLIQIQTQISRPCRKCSCERLSSTCYSGVLAMVLLVCMCQLHKVKRSVVNSQPKQQFDQVALVFRARGLVEPLPGRSVVFLLVLIH